jgi:hypothetical protein
MLRIAGPAVRSTAAIGKLMINAAFNKPTDPISRDPNGSLGRADSWWAR